MMIAYLIICAISTIALLVIAFVERDPPPVDAAVRAESSRPPADAEAENEPAQKLEQVRVEAENA